MNRFRPFLLLLVVATAFGQEPEKKDAKPDPKPFFQDRWSGKTVRNMDMAADLVRGRFYNAPRYGSKAPEFVLPELGTGKSISLEDLRAEKPVVLLFASYGCDVFRDGVDEVLDVYDEFKDQFEFAMIYIREAHSFDGLGPEMAIANDPTTALERNAVAERCRVDIGIPFRILVDAIDDRVGTRWAAWPVRIFVVDTNGTVLYTGKPGPWGFSPGKEFEAAAAKELRAHADRFNQESLEQFLRNYPES